MGLVFAAEVSKGGKHRIGSGLAQATKGGVLYDGRPSLKGLDVTLLSLPVADLGQYLQYLPRTNPTGRAFAAGFVLAEIHEESSHIDHALVFIHDDHPT